MSNQYPQIPPLGDTPTGNSILAQLLGFALWTSSMATGIVSISIPDTGPSWKDLLLNIIAKSSPIISTWFLYIINRKTIDSYFKQVWGSFKAKTKKKKKSEHNNRHRRDDHHSAHSN